MNTKPLLRTFAAGLVLAALGTAGSALADDAPAPTHGAPEATAVSDTKVAVTSTPVSVEHQRGLVIEATGEAHGLAASISLYENQAYGSFAQVVLGDPEDDLIGAVEQTAPFVIDGRVELNVNVAGKPAVLSGTVVETDTTKVVDPQQDAGEQQVIRGTQSQLVTDLALTYDGVTVPLQAAPAFAFDLEVRRVTLYGR